MDSTSNVCLCLDHNCFLSLLIYSLQKPLLTASLHPNPLGLKGISVASPLTFQKDSIPRRWIWRLHRETV